MRCGMNSGLTGASQDLRHSRTALLIGVACLGVVLCIGLAMFILHPRGGFISGEVIAAEGETLTIRTAKGFETVRIDNRTTFREGRAVIHVVPLLSHVIVAIDDRDGVRIARTIRILSQSTNSFPSPHDER